MRSLDVYPRCINQEPQVRRVQFVKFSSTSNSVFRMYRFTVRKRWRVSICSDRAPLKASEMEVRPIYLRTVPGSTSSGLSTSRCT